MIHWKQIPSYTQDNDDDVKDSIQINRLNSWLISIVSIFSNPHQVNDNKDEAKLHQSSKRKESKRDITQRRSHSIKSDKDSIQYEREIVVIAASLYMIGAASRGTRNSVLKKWMINEMLKIVRQVRNDGHPNN